MKQKLLQLITGKTLPHDLKVEIQRDEGGPQIYDPGPDVAIRSSLKWLCTAQDNSASNDGGVSRHFSWLHGWATSYPETTGYIVATFLEHADRSADCDLRDRGRRMLDWLVSIQLPCGGFQGGVIGTTPVVPVTFNTGQILIGLVAGVHAFGHQYVLAMQRAADWLAATQDADGCWRRYGTPFATPGEKVYETHVAWGLLEAARAKYNDAYVAAALRNMRWAVGHQQPNGWFAHCCLTDSLQPLTHTIGYALRGLVEGYLYSREPWLLDASLRTAEALLRCQRADGFLPGRLDSNWRPTVKWACLTGIVQIALCWFLLHRELQRPDLYMGALKATSYVRRTIHYSGRSEIAGGVKGSFPVSGQYGQYELLNWAAKFSIDANTAELAARSATMVSSER